MSKGQLWVDMEIIGRLVAAALPPADPLCQLFEPISGGAGDIVEPTMDQLLMAHDAFYSLPDAEQRRILNGWSPYPDRDYQNADDSRDYFRALHICTPNDKGIPAAHSISADVGTDPVHVFIREGTTRSEALNALDAIASMLAERWHVLIDHRQTPREMALSKTQASAYWRDVREKGRTPVKPADPQKPVSDWIGKRIGPTPAVA
jgi:hypothetical protein